MARFDSLQILINSSNYYYSTCTQLIAAHAQSVALSNTGKVMGLIPMNAWTSKMYTSMQRNASHFG